MSDIPATFYIDKAINYAATANMHQSDITDAIGEKRELLARIAGLEAKDAERDEAERRAIAFIAPGGHDEHIALRVLTDPVLHAFAFVANREYKRAEQAETERDALQAVLRNIAEEVLLFNDMVHASLGQLREGGE